MINGQTTAGSHFGETFSSPTSSILALSLQIVGLTEAVVEEQRIRVMSFPLALRRIRKDVGKGGGTALTVVVVVVWLPMP